MPHFDQQTDPYFRILNPKVCVYHGAGSSFELIEKKKTGKARITIQKMAFPCFHVPNTEDNCLFTALDAEETGPEQVRRCADHLVFVYDRGTGRWSLHILEFKKKINEAKWDNDVLMQFTGALMRAYAIAGVLRIADFKTIYLHCGYRESPWDTVPALHKRGTGRKAPRNCLKEPVTLYAPYQGASYQKKCLNRPIKLDSATGEKTIPALDL